jgi:REP element-mobilizing transposase RayT
LREVRTHGGRRAGAGKKAVLVGGRRRMRHGVRAAMSRELPLHVTVRLCAGLGGLRGAEAMRVVREAIRNGQKEGFSVVHFCVLGNHVHLLVEAWDRVWVARGMQGLLSGLARRLNRLWGRCGRVFADRYHDEVLAAFGQVRAALRYVLQNARRHGVRLGGLLDPCSSEAWFDGYSWRSDGERVAFALQAAAVRREVGAAPCVRPRTERLAELWRRGGAIRCAEAWSGAVAGR